MMAATFERGPLIRYEVIWKSGHVEEFEAHQVMLPPPINFGDGPPRNRLTIHGEIGGHWQLILDADYDEISTVRNLGPVSAGRKGVDQK